MNPNQVFKDKDKLCSIDVVVRCNSCNGSFILTVIAVGVLDTDIEKAVNSHKCPMCDSVNWDWVRKL